MNEYENCILELRSLIFFISYEKRDYFFFILKVVYIKRISFNSVFNGFPFNFLVKTNERLNIFINILLLYFLFSYGHIFSESPSQFF